MKLSPSAVNESNLEKYKAFVNDNYKEPVNGEDEDATSRILKAIDVDYDDVDEEMDGDEEPEDDADQENQDSQLYE